MGGGWKNKISEREKGREAREGRGKVENGERNEMNFRPRASNYQPLVSCKTKLLLVTCQTLKFSSHPCFSPVYRRTAGDVSCSRPKTEQTCVLLQLRSEGTFWLCKSQCVTYISPPVPLCS